MSDFAVGIDLGTSNSCVAIARNGSVEVLPNSYGENTTASVVAFSDDGSITVGNAARANVIHDPQNTVSSAKRLIGRYFFSEEVRKAQAICAYEIVEGPNHSVRIEVRSEEFSLPEISAMILREMKHTAESRLGESVSKAVLTVPAYFNDNQRQATKDAGRVAGLEVLRILNEPTAAALAYGFGRTLDQRVAVYDLGGGTFDVSILEIGKDIFEVLATCGDTFLGGDDFDDRLIDLLADEFVSCEGINPRNDPYAFEKLKVAAESAKRTLSEEDEVEIRIPDLIEGPDGEPRALERRLTREQYSQLVHDLVQSTFKVCDEALQQAGITTRDLDGVILVGGPTRLPMVRQAVGDYFQQEPKTDVDPDEVVAKGAAIHADSLVNESQRSFLLDVTPLDLRIGVAGGLAEPVIERNTPVPIEQTRAFTTFKDFQESVKIRAYQGDSRQADENVLLGQFEFAGFKKARRGEVEIAVTFEIDADGIVNVTASDPETGEAASTRITLSSGLSDQELEHIIDDDRTARVTETSAAEPVQEASASTAAEEPSPDDQELAPIETSADPEVLPEEVLPEEFDIDLEIADSTQAEQSDDPSPEPELFAPSETPSLESDDEALDLLDDTIDDDELLELAQEVRPDQGETQPFDADGQPLSVSRPPAGASSSPATDAATTERSAGLPPSVDEDELDARRELFDSGATDLSAGSEDESSE